MQSNAKPSGNENLIQFVSGIEQVLGGLSELFSDMFCHSLTGYQLKVQQVNFLVWCVCTKALGNIWKNTPRASNWRWSICVRHRKSNLVLSLSQFFAFIVAKTSLCSNVAIIFSPECHWCSWIVFCLFV